ncbi:hypothetical protein R0K17_32465, partial [Planococcus sp. SIMBA_143]
DDARHPELEQYEPHILPCLIDQQIHQVARSQTEGSRKQMSDYDYDEQGDDDDEFHAVTHISAFLHLYHQEEGAEI